MSFFGASLSVDYGDSRLHCGMGAVVLFKVPAGRRGGDAQYIREWTLAFLWDCRQPLFLEASYAVLLVTYVITIVDFHRGNLCRSDDRPDGNKIRNPVEELPLFTTAYCIQALAVVALGICVPTFAQNSINIVGSLVTPLSPMYTINLRWNVAHRPWYHTCSSRALYYFPNVNG